MPLRILLAIVLTSLPLLGAEPPARTYRNPVIEGIDAADPHVIKYEGKYYLYPTTDSRGYDCYVSTDLVKWEKKARVFEDRRGGAWAPDVFHNKKGDGKFYLYWTLRAPRSPEGRPREQIGVAVADGPLGPFVDKGTLEMEAIDAHMFQDDDGKLYLYYADRKGGFKMAVQEMETPLKEKGEPKILFHPTPNTWEHGVTEGAWMIKRNGTYYLTYSGGGADFSRYAVGYATSKSPLGPFTKFEGNPIAKAQGNVFGPGHHCVVDGPDGKLWMIYHQKNVEKQGWGRFIAIDPFWFDEKGVIHAKVSRGSDEKAP